MTIRGLINRLTDRLILNTKIFHFFSLTILDSWKYVPLKNYLALNKLVLFWKICEHAQQNYASLSNAYALASIVENNHLKGAVVECGVWRGGCTAVMATVAHNAKSNRKIWLFDSFEGMPEASREDLGGDALQLARGTRSGELCSVGTNIASVDEVKTLLFKQLHLKEDNVTIIKGWFQNTLPAYRSLVGDIAILRIDGDWYESTKVCLDSLYDNVVNDGYIIIDDYGFFPGCKKAVDEFFESRGLKIQLNTVDYSRVFFKKSEGTTDLADSQSKGPLDSEARPPCLDWE